MKYNRLGNTDLNLSALGYGASSLGGVFKSFSEKEGIDTVHRAIDLGINYVDVSPYYGLTKAESVLGKALNTVPRDKFILSTKVGRYGPDFTDFDMSESRIRQSLEDSLSRLRVEEVDMLLLHDIEFVDPEIIKNEAIPCLQKLKDEGKIRYIGVTGYPMKTFKDVMIYSEIDCILSYCRYALHDTSLESLIPDLKMRGIGVINASPTGMGILTSRGAPDWHPASVTLKEACEKAIQLCKKANTNITKLAMQFAVSHDYISSTLVGSTNSANLINNVQWIEEPINETLLAEVRDIFKPIKDVVWTTGLEINND